MQYHMDINININDYDKNNQDNLIFKKKKLIEICKNLSKLEYLEIFNIIQENNCQYSENKNGIFINLTNVTEFTIDTIFNFINFIKLKKDDLNKYEEFINNAKKNITETKKDNEITINEVQKEYDEYDNNDGNIINDNNSNYLFFSSDEDEDVENKISLKKKKNKYSGKKAKMIKSIKDCNDNNKTKNKK